jgi:hypothetical protein
MLALIPGTELRADGLIYPINFDHQVNFGSDYQKSPTPPPFVTKRGANAWTTPLLTSTNPDGTVTAVTLGVDRSKSWVTSNIDDGQVFSPDAVEILRRHEQVHFDLAALQLRDWLNNGYRHERDAWTALDSFFEADTEYGKYRGRQQQWVDEINWIKGQRDTNAIGTLRNFANGLYGGMPRPDNGADSV